VKQKTITIPPTEYEDLTICVAIPDLEDVRAFSDRLHAAGKPWGGIFQGWDGEYLPSEPTSPPGSKMTFTPAEFVLGDSRVWFFGRMWENGDEQLPTETCNGPAAQETVACDGLVYA
jgi:hypothetical protein